MAGIGPLEWSQLAREASDTIIVGAPGPDVILWPWKLTVEDEKRLAANHDKVVAALGLAAKQTISLDEVDSDAPANPDS